MKTLKTANFATYVTQPLKITYGADEMVKFTNKEHITQSDILAITADEKNEFFSLFY